MTGRILVFSVAALIAACGGGSTQDGDDGDDGPGEPVLVPGGGVAGGAIAGGVNVFVIDDATGAPIAGAAVQVGDGPSATTDGEGLAVIADAAMTGPQTVTATAAGKVAATWIGVAVTSATIPLEPTTVPTASVSGTIAGWNTVPTEAFGNYTLGVVLYSLTDDLGARENTLPQPMSGGAPLNTCLRSAVSNTCAWQMTARTGRQIHFAVIVEGNPQGTTSDPSDDTYVLRGYAIGSSMTLTAGQQVTNESLTLILTSSHVAMTVGFPAAAPGLAERIALPMLDLGDDGRLVFALPTVTPASASTQVLAATGQFAGTYDVVGVATPPGTSAMPYSTVIARGVATGGTVQIGAWLPPPASVSASAGTYSFAGVDAASIRYATFTRGTTRVWTASILDGSTSFTLPTVNPDPLGTGSFQLEISAADVASFDPADFTINDVTAGLGRAAGATTTFTR